VAQKTLLGLSILFHGALGVLVYRIEMGTSRAATSIQVAEAKKRESVQQELEPPPPPPPPPKKAARRTAPAAPQTTDAPPPAPAPLAALPDFGLELHGGIGGLAVAAPATHGVGAANGPIAARAAAPAGKRTAARAALPSDACDEPAAKPKPVNVPQPAYTDRAREASVEGKVRVELTVDETGRVVSVRVLQGLGYGLDEAAVVAARSATFEPAVRCGKPTRATFTISMRFSAA
jgi:periplasmic protein TonB